MRTIRLGAGAGFAGDRIQPALDLIEQGALDYIVFECLAERTIAMAQQRKQAAASLGYDLLLESRLRAVLPACREHGTRLISNMGAANPLAAAIRCREVAEELGLKNLTIAAITGDDVMAEGGIQAAVMLDSGEPMASLADSIVSANVYIGARPIVDALAMGADVVIVGRVADAALFLGPLVHEFGWRFDDWERLGKGTFVGHMLECAGQLTGGYFADPPYKQVSGLANLGFPYADVAENGDAVFGKLEMAGGAITLATCKEQLLYEVHDPAAYINPDVVADFSGVEFEVRADGCVSTTGASGRGCPETLKVSVGVNEGFIGEAQISYAGGGALDRGRLAAEIVQEQLASLGCVPQDLRIEFIGVNSVLPSRLGATIGLLPEVPEIRLRVAANTATRQEAELVTQVVEALYTNGPAGGGGVTRSVTPVLAITSGLIERSLVRQEIHLEVSK